MSNITEWGEVVSSNFFVEDQATLEKRATAKVHGEMRLVEGQIRKIVTVAETNPLQATQKFTTYECDVLYPDGTSGVLVKVRALQPLFGGGLNDFLEVLPADPGPLATEDIIDRSLKPGTHVLIGFIGGAKGSPVILGALPHFGKLAIKSRPTALDGPGHLEGEFQGVNFKIDKFGAFKLKFNGPKTVLGVSPSVAAAGTSYEIDKFGSTEIKTNALQSVLIDRVTKKITITNGLSKLEMSQIGDKVSLGCTKADITTKADFSVTAGAGAKLTAIGPANISSVAGINLQKGGVAIEPFVLGNQLALFLTELMSGYLAMANVIGNLGVPTPPILTGPAIAAMVARIPLLLSQHIKGI